MNPQSEPLLRMAALRRATRLENRRLTVGNTVRRLHIPVHLVRSLNNTAAPDDPVGTLLPPPLPHPREAGERKKRGIAARSIYYSPESLTAPVAPNRFVLRSALKPAKPDHRVGTASRRPSAASTNADRIAHLQSNRIHDITGTPHPFTCRL